MREAAGRPDEQGGEEPPRRVVYCVVPADLAAKLHDLLERHWRDEPGLRVVVERRASDRRRAVRRRVELEAEERRRVRNVEGRRVADRRAELLPAAVAALPRQARRYAERLSFLERVEPSAQHELDVADRRLVVRHQQGEESALNELYLRHFDGVYGYARVALRDSHEAEDVTQQVFMAAFEKLAGFELRPGVPVRAWLYRIVRNTTLKALERRGRLSVEDPAVVQDRLESANELGSRLAWLSDQEVAFFVERLPEAQRQVLILRYMLDFKTSEIAQVLERSPKAVRQLESRALRSLRQRLLAVGGRPLRGRRAPMRVRTKPAPVLARRRFALSGFGARRPLSRH